MKTCNGAFPGTVCAGDGVVFQIRKPPAKEVDGDVQSYYNRKGFFAYGMQGFVGPSCEFLSISSKLCSSTHDSTHYIVSDVSEHVRQGHLPQWAHIVFDEAYPNKTQEFIDRTPGRVVDELVG